MALDRAGVLPSCPKCQSHDVADYAELKHHMPMMCLACNHHWVARKQEVRGRFYHEEKQLGSFDCNWCVGEIDVEAKSGEDAV